MTVTETLNPEATQPIPDEVISAGLGHTALTETLESTGKITRDIELGGEHYTTDLPDGLNPFEADAEGELEELPLLPSSLDLLPVGHFEISRATTSVEGQPYLEERTVGVRQNEFGKVIDIDSFSSDNQVRWRLEKSTDKLMTELGYELSPDPGNYGNRISGVPTPETVVAAAAKLGVEIKIFPGYGLIKRGEYVGTFAEGKFPVATKAETQYRHDIEDDHLTAMVLGGEPLKIALQESAKKILKDGRDAIIDTATFNIDAFTATLRAVIATHSQAQGASYSSERGRDTLYKFGEPLGMSLETIDKILNTAQENAKNFGLEVNELD